MSRADPDPPVGPFGIAAIVVCVAFLAAGIAWPQAAESLLRLLMVTLAGGFVAARAWRALPARTTRDAYSPFDGTARTPAEAPQVLRTLTTELRAADHDRAARRTPIPWPVRRTVIGEAARRLAERHGLDLEDPEQHARIRSLVSEATWLLIDPRGRERRPGTRATAGSRLVPIARLDSILDELETL